ncbi:MAG: UDP-3-O-acyl-N-acetylglucosamine deacetylase [Bacteroidales bacterium]|nr:UDP-3-O-acyl-N-acetylglucosamine deacetylase [Bacteroidales bacterium]
MQEFQKTLRRRYDFEGKGLHSGRQVKMSLLPAPENTGIRFLRTDLGPDAYIEAVADYVTQTQRGTTLEKGEIRVSTIEHILATFSGLGVDNAVIALDNLEVPILDGSSAPYIQAILPDGLEEQSAPRRWYTLEKPIFVRDEQSGAELEITPADEFSIELTVDYNSEVLGVQHASFKMGDDFATEFAPCRTFVFFHELEFLAKNGLIKGGDVENALVIVEKPVPQEELDRMADLFNVQHLTRTPAGYLDNVTLRFPNECVRHKLMDIMGDFSLVGCRFRAHVRAVKSGHKINTDIAKRIRYELLGGTSEC